MRADLPPNRVSKWKSGQGEPTARQALRIARVLRVPLEWLADEEAGDEPTALPGLSPDEAVMLDVIRDSGLTRRDVTRLVLQAVRDRGPVPAPIVGREFDPSTGDPLPAPGDRSRKGEAG